MYAYNNMHVYIHIHIYIYYIYIYIYIYSTSCCTISKKFNQPSQANFQSIKVEI